MSFFSDKLTAHLDRIGWGEYGLNKELKKLPKENRLSEQYVYSLCRGEKSPKIETLEKLAAVPGLGISLGMLKAWRAVDEYGPHAILQAYEVLVKEDPAFYEKDIEEAEKKYMEKQKKKNSQ